MVNETNKPKVTKLRTRGQMRRNQNPASEDNNIYKEIQNKTITETIK